ncbi:GNAT family N-acetyltransferase [Mucilaginibacter sp. McL0603]|uniref:GNAT family N-acetyltransferase n=1 Tax=Mucilaginibacter sp. McL0603 TaxID=3415670 RepID=UPI003CF14E60
MSEETVNIRSAILGDLPGILDIYNHAILHTTSVYSEHPHTYEMRLTWYNDRISSGFPVFVAETDGQIIGFSTFGHFRVWPCYRYTVEHSVYVHIDHRGKGISKLLLQPLIDRAREMKLHAMIAGIDGGNKISYQLHQSFGFVEVAHFKEVGFKFGRWLDLKFMQLILHSV